MFSDAPILFVAIAVLCLLICCTFCCILICCYKRRSKKLLNAVEEPGYTVETREVHKSLTETDSMAPNNVKQISGSMQWNVIAVSGPGEPGVPAPPRQGQHRTPGDMGSNQLQMMGIQRALKKTMSITPSIPGSTTQGTPTMSTKLSGSDSMFGTYPGPEIEQEPPTLGAANLSTYDISAALSGEVDERDSDQLRQWLMVKVRLPQYYDLFVESGLNSLYLVSQISDRNDLEYMGIRSKGHQIVLLNAIRKLNVHVFKD